MGMNLHLSEVISDLVEPMVDKFEGGKESISTEDMIARFVGLNDTNKGWSEWSYYDGLRCEEYMGCGTCIGDWTRLLSEDEPEPCVCEGEVTPGYRRVTARWLKFYRRRRWEDNVGWDPRDEGRTWLSKDVLPEDLQNYQVPMVILGFDVVSLYPNLDIGKVG